MKASGHSRSFFYHSERDRRQMMPAIRGCFRAFLKRTAYASAMFSAALTTQTVGSSVPSNQGTALSYAAVLATNEPPPPAVKLGKVPSIRLGPQPPVSVQEAAKIRKLIAGLAEVDSPDFGLSPTLWGQ